MTPTARPVVTAQRDSWCQAVLTLEHRDTEFILDSLLDTQPVEVHEGVDHCVILHRLQSSFGLSGSAFAWLTSYLSLRQQYVSHHGDHSETNSVGAVRLQRALVR